MKATELAKTLRERLNVTCNNEILPAFDQAMIIASAPPIGATVILSNGNIASSPFGLSNPPTLAEVDALQQAFRMVANSMEQQKVALVRQEVLAEMKAEGKEVPEA